MLKGHILRVIHHQVYLYTKKNTVSPWVGKHLLFLVGKVDLERRHVPEERGGCQVLPGRDVNASDGGQASTGSSRFTGSRL